MQLERIRTETNQLCARKASPLFVTLLSQFVSSVSLLVFYSYYRLLSLSVLRVVTGYWYCRLPRVTVNSWLPFPGEYLQFESGDGSRPHRLGIAACVGGEMLTTIRS